MNAVFFLEERYKYHDGFNYYSDALIIEESTMLVAVDDFDEEYEEVTYYPIIFLNTPNTTHGRAYIHGITLQPCASTGQLS